MTRQGSRAARLGRRAGTVAMTLVVLLCAAWVFPALLGYERHVITGGSMSGAFEKGSVAFARAVPVEDLGLGDVITYQPPTDSGVSTLVTHRIVSSDVDDAGRTVWVTQGDANADPDPWEFSLTRPTQPVVEFTAPWLGYLFVALADRELRLLLIGVPSALLALTALLEVARALRSEPEEAATTTVPSVGGAATRG